jgi:hypothetical protein
MDDANLNSLTPASSLLRSYLRLDGSSAEGKLKCPFKILTSCWCCVLSLLTTNASHCSLAPTMASNTNEEDDIDYDEIEQVQETKEDENNYVKK